MSSLLGSGLIWVKHFWMWVQYLITLYTSPPQPPSSPSCIRPPPNHCNVEWITTFTPVQVWHSVVGGGGANRTEGRGDQAGKRKTLMNKRWEQRGRVRLEYEWPPLQSPGLIADLYLNLRDVHGILKSVFLVGTCYKWPWWVITGRRLSRISLTEKLTLALKWVSIKNP